MFFLSLMMEGVLLRLFVFSVSSGLTMVICLGFSNLYLLLFKGSSVLCVSTTGGPAVGDIRSRCLRLSDESTSEALAVRRLLGHRLPIDPHKAKKDWYFLSKMTLFS